MRGSKIRLQGQIRGIIATICLPRIGPLLRLVAGTLNKQLAYSEMLNNVEDLQ